MNIVDKFKKASDKTSLWNSLNKKNKRIIFPSDSFEDLKMSGKEFKYYNMRCIFLLLDNNEFIPCKAFLRSKGGKYTYIDIPNDATVTITSIPKTSWSPKYYTSSYKIKKVEHSDKDEIKEFLSTIKWHDERMNE